MRPLDYGAFDAHVLHVAQNGSFDFASYVPGFGFPAPFFPVSGPVTYPPQPAHLTTRPSERRPVLGARPIRPRPLPPARPARGSVAPNRCIVRLMSGRVKFSRLSHFRPPLREGVTRPRPNRWFRSPKLRASPPS